MFVDEASLEIARTRFPSLGSFETTVTKKPVETNVGVITPRYLLDVRHLPTHRKQSDGMHSCLLKVQIKAHF